MRSGPVIVVYWGNAALTACSQRAAKPTDHRRFYVRRQPRSHREGHREELRGRRDILHEARTAVSQPLGREGSSQGLASGAVSGLLRRRDAHAVHQPRVLHRRDAHPDRAVAARADRPRAGLHVRRPRRRGGRPGPVAVRRHARAHLRARLRGVHGVLRRAAQHPAGAAHRRAGALRRRPGGGLEGGGHLLVPGPVRHLRVPHRARALPAGRAHHPAHHDRARAQRHGHRHRRGRPDRRVLLHRPRHGRGDRRDHGHRRPREALPGRHAGRAVHARRAAARRGAAPSHHRGRRDHLLQRLGARRRDGDREGVGHRRLRVRHLVHPAAFPRVAEGAGDHRAPAGRAGIRPAGAAGRAETEQRKAERKIP